MVHDEVLQGQQEGKSICRDEDTTPKVDTICESIVPAVRDLVNKSISTHSEMKRLQQEVERVQQDWKAKCDALADTQQSHRVLQQRFTDVSTALSEARRDRKRIQQQQEAAARHKHRHLERGRRQL